jgi:hypothetical protein
MVVCTSTAKSRDFLAKSGRNLINPGDLRVLGAKSSGLDYGP